MLNACIDKEIKIFQKYQEQDIETIQNWSEGDKFLMYIWYWLDFKEPLNECTEQVKKSMLERLQGIILQINPQEAETQNAIKEQIKKNLQEIENINAQNKKITQKMLLLDDLDEETRQVAEETKQANRKRITNLEKQNDILQNKWSLKKFLKRLPDILLKIFELNTKALTEAENRDFEKDLTEIIRFTLSNLTISNKKSLKIGMNWTLEMLFFGEKPVWQPH